MKKSKTDISNLKNNKIFEIYATKGDNPGEINLQWDSVGGATGYVVQVSKPNAKQNWKHYDIVSESSCSIAGLKTKQNYLFRVAAINRKEQYPWSNEVEKRI
jgi:hypothetical protein